MSSRPVGTLVSTLEYKPSLVGLGIRTDPTDHHNRIPGLRDGIRAIRTSGLDRPDTLELQALKARSVPMRSVIALSFFYRSILENRLWKEATFLP
jgi:hypothetical protein